MPKREDRCAVVILTSHWCFQLQSHISHHLTQLKVPLHCLSLQTHTHTRNWKLKICTIMSNFIFFFKVLFRNPYVSQGISTGINTSEHCPALPTLLHCTKLDNIERKENHKNTAISVSVLRSQHDQLLTRMGYSFYKSNSSPRVLPEQANRLGT